MCATIWLQSRHIAHWARSRILPQVLTVSIAALQAKYPELPEATQCGHVMGFEECRPAAATANANGMGRKLASEAVCCCKARLATSGLHLEDGARPHANALLQDLGLLAHCVAFHVDLSIFQSETETSETLQQGQGQMTHGKRCSLAQEIADIVTEGG